MDKLKIFIAITLLTTALLISCDDFFSPVIEIFNESKPSINIEQKQKEEVNQNDVN